MKPKLLCPDCDEKILYSPDEPCEKCRKVLRARVASVRMVRDEGSPLYDPKYKDYAISCGGAKLFPLGVKVIDDASARILSGEVEIPDTLPSRKVGHHDSEKPESPPGAYRVFGSGTFQRGSGSLYMRGSND
jgi:hypothetical protein